MRIAFVLSGESYPVYRRSREHPRAPRQRLCVESADARGCQHRVGKKSNGSSFSKFPNCITSNNFHRVPRVASRSLDTRGRWYSFRVTRVTRVKSLGCPALTRFCNMSLPTASSLLRSRKPLAQFGEFVELKNAVAVLSNETHRRDKRCESVSKRVDASELRRVTDMKVMDNKMQALSDAFQVLSDVVVSELEVLKTESTSIEAEMNQLKEQLKWTHSCESKMRSLEEFVQRKVVEEGATRQTRDEFLQVSVARMEGRVEGCETFVDAFRRDGDEKNAQDLAHAAARIDFQRTVSGRIDRLEQRQKNNEQNIYRTAKGVAKQVRETNDALAASAAYGDARARELQIYQTNQTGNTRHVELSDNEKAVYADDELHSLGVSSETAAALMSPAARRYIRDDR
jgi:hypothetical protein